MYEPCRSLVDGCLIMLAQPMLHTNPLYLRMQSTSVRIDATTHGELKKLATSLGTSIGDTVALAVRRLRQYQIGVDFELS